MRLAVCQNFFNHAASSFEQRPGKVGKAFVIPMIFRGIPDNGREVGLRARESFRIFQRPGKSFVLDHRPPRWKGWYVREENPSHPLVSPVRVPFGSGSVLTFILRGLVTRGYAHSNPWRETMMIPVKTRKISWSHCSNIRTVFTGSVQPTWRVPCICTSFLFHFVGFLSLPSSRRRVEPRREGSGF